MNGHRARALRFTVLTFLSSWLLAAGFYALGGRLNGLVAVVVLLIYMFMPMTIAIIVQKVIYKEPLKEPGPPGSRLTMRNETRRLLSGIWSGTTCPPTEFSLGPTRLHQNRPESFKP